MPHRALLQLRSAPMSRPVRLAAFTLALGLVVAACGGGTSNPEVSIASDGTFAATTVDGEAFTSTDFAGQDVMLWFWAPW